jgi:hypothetical protein
MVCESCNHEVTIYAARSKTTKHRKAVYGRCETEGCRKKGRKICYAGAQISKRDAKPANKSPYAPFIVPRPIWDTSEKQIAARMKGVVKRQKYLPQRVGT